jgi:hypothetical protein
MRDRFAPMNLAAADTHVPARIAHRGGNSRAALGQALAAGVDWIEVDCWRHYGRLIASHDRPLWPLPLTSDGWRLRLAMERPLLLPELIAATRDGPQLLLDFKGLNPRLARSVAEALQAGDAVGRAAVCGQSWPVLEAAARLAPGLRVVYSFGNAAHVLAMRRRPPTAPPLTAASVAHSLLTPQLMREFRDRGIAVIAWTVNDPARAQELAALGVAGITSDRLDLLTRLPRLNNAG